MKKLGCASCGGTKKMKTGGMATKAMGPAKKPFAAGIPYYTGAGQTGPESMKNGGIKKEHPITVFRKANEARQTIVKKSLPKAQLGKTTDFTKYKPEPVYMSNKEKKERELEMDKQKAEDYYKKNPGTRPTSYTDTTTTSKPKRKGIFKSGIFKSGAVVKSSMKKMQTGGKTTGKATADSTEIYTKRLNTFTKNHGGSLPVKQLSNKDTHKQYKMVTDVQRQRNKGQVGYDKNGFPIKKK